jgi:hypothetical protein
MKSIFLCRSFRVKGIRVILAALVVIGLAAAISMPALARQDISAGNPMQMKDTYENPLGDGGLRGDPDGGEGTPQVDLPDQPHQDGSRTDSRYRAEADFVSGPLCEHRISSFFRFLYESVRRASK